MQPGKERWGGKHSGEVEDKVRKILGDENLRENIAIKKKLTTNQMQGKGMGSSFKE